LDESYKLWDAQNEHLLATVTRLGAAQALRQSARAEQGLALVNSMSSDGLPPYEKGFMFEERGRLLMALGKTDDARRAFSLAADNLKADDWTVRNNTQHLLEVKELAKVR
jgi:predicted negative regulator of RcsB-dependent stress response